MHLASAWQAELLGNFIVKYLRFETALEVTVVVVSISCADTDDRDCNYSCTIQPERARFALHMHLPVYVWRRGTLKHDKRTTGDRGKPLRSSFSLAFLKNEHCAPTDIQDCLYQSQTSLINFGRHDRFWVSCMLVDSYFEEEGESLDLLEDDEESDDDDQDNTDEVVPPIPVTVPSASTHPGGGPARSGLKNGGLCEDRRWKADATKNVRDPREDFLNVVHYRVMVAEEEWTNTVLKFGRFVDEFGTVSQPSISIDGPGII